MILKTRTTPHFDENDFSDNAVIAVRRGDKRVGLRMDKPCYFSHACEAPIYIVIDKCASGQELRQMAERFDVPLSKMIEFRDAQAL